MLSAAGLGADREPAAFCRSARRSEAFRLFSAISASCSEVSGIFWLESKVLLFVNASEPWLKESPSGMAVLRGDKK
jgi:hypothetical protein